jgi:type II secretory pathway pseudopilin PulG
MKHTEENISIKGSPRDLFLHLFVFITLYFSFFSIVQLIFSYLDILFPDSTLYLASLTDNIRYYLAILIIMFPVYCGASFLVVKEDRENPQKKEIKSRRFLVALTLFLAGLISVSALGCIVYYFLTGEAGIRTLLKTVVIVSLGAVFYYYYYWDLKRNWKTRQLLLLLGAVSALVIFCVVYGFSLIGSPWRAKAIKEDQAKVAALQSIQTKIIQYLREKKQLPDSLAELNIQQANSVNLMQSDVARVLPTSMPIDLKGSSVYKKTGKLTFQLCANFKFPASSSDMILSTSGSYMSTTNASVGGVIPYEGFEDDQKNWNWDHAAGAVCFDRAVKEIKAKKN